MIDTNDITEEYGIDPTAGDTRSGGLEEDISRIGILSKACWKSAKHNGKYG